MQIQIKLIRQYCQFEQFIFISKFNTQKITNITDLVQNSLVKVIQSLNLKEAKGKLTKKDHDRQARLQLNFQREEMRNIRQRCLSKKQLKDCRLWFLQKTRQNIRQEWQVDKQPGGSQKMDENPNQCEKKNYIKKSMKRATKLYLLSQMKKINYFNLQIQLLKRTSSFRIISKQLKRALSFLLIHSQLSELNCAQIDSLHYKKDQNVQIFDITTKQSNIVIINHGKVNLYLKKRQNNSVIYELVRTIQTIEGKSTLNVVGYSNLILNQNIDISTVASEMSSGHVLKRLDVLECTDKILIDYQDLHQMRQNMLVISLKQPIEDTSLNDSEFYFIPNIFILTCRYNKMSKQLRNKNKRRDSRIQIRIDQVKVQYENDWYNVKKEDSESYFEQQPYYLSKNQKKMNQFESLLEIEESPMQIEEPNKENQAKIFQHFLKHHNINQIVAHYEKACKIKSHIAFQKTIHKITYDQVHKKTRKHQQNQRYDLMNKMFQKKGISLLFYSKFITFHNNQQTIDKMHG